MRASRTRRRRGARRVVLARYSDELGQPHEIVSRPGARGGTLVVDRPLHTGATQRLLANLGADEPAENARIVCRQYLLASTEDRLCRVVLPDDWLDELPGRPLQAARWCLEDQPSILAGGRAVRIGLVPSQMSIPALRWTRLDRAGEPATPVSLREAIAAQQSYEPFRELTMRALAAYEPDPEVSVTTLRAELDRVLTSPIVLNRALREAVLDQVGRGLSSMSEIAIRCGRLKQDRRGRVNGETSWLGRRIGLLPEAGRELPTPWVHSDVLGLIARDGLGISPREAELG
jgi:hypothetical protein